MDEEPEWNEPHSVLSPPREHKSEPNLAPNKQDMNMNCKSQSHPQGAVICQLFFFLPELCLHFVPVDLLLRPNLKTCFLLRGNIKGFLGKSQNGRQSCSSHHGAPGVQTCQFSPVGNFKELPTRIATAPCPGSLGQQGPGSSVLTFASLSAITCNLPLKATGKRLMGSKTKPSQGLFESVFWGSQHLTPLPPFYTSGGSFVSHLNKWEWRKGRWKWIHLNGVCFMSK